jgi:ABC-2 type transport system ATP-binding protein
MAQTNEQNIPAIMVKNLIHTFGSTTAVNNISFSVNQVEILGFLGPNGAGKTTTIKILTTMLTQTAGIAQVLGHDVKLERDSVRKQIGIVFQDPSLDMDLTGMENLRFHGLLYHMTEDLIKQRIKSLISLIELEEYANNFVKTYSGGMRRRLEIIRALLHSPKILFLDEPTLGLDPQSRRRIWDYLREINTKEKITIFLTTHYMDEADQLCNRVAIIDNGRIVAFDSPTKLKSIVGGDVITLEMGQKSDLKIFLETLESRKPFPIIKAEISQGNIVITCQRGENAIPSLVNLASEIKYEIKSVRLKKPSLEDVFFHFTGKKIREEGGENMPLSRMEMKKTMRGRMKNG